MKLASVAKSYDGVTLRQAALVAGFAYLLNPVSYAEFSIYPKLVAAGNAAQTAQNISAHLGLFAAAILCYIVSFIGDVVIAWALYVLLAPVNRALSLLAAWFQLVYAAVALCSVFGLLDVYHLLSTPYYLTIFGAGQLHAQVWLLLHSFHYEWSMSLIIFGIHLVLVGYLVFRSGYIPWIFGIALSIAGLGWIIGGFGPYVLPNANLDFTFITAFGEVIFTLWLWIRGWKVKEPPATRIS
jgi:Domain of unknown function (DUF4386)